jgi:hypothetical protein
MSEFAHTMTTEVYAAQAVQHCAAATAEVDAQSNKPAPAS